MSRPIDTDDLVAIAIILVVVGLPLFIIIRLFG